MLKKHIYLCDRKIRRAKTKQGIKIIHRKRKKKETNSAHHRTQHGRKRLRPSISGLQQRITLSPTTMLSSPALVFCLFVSFFLSSLFRLLTRLLSNLRVWAISRPCQMPPKSTAICPGPCNVPVIISPTKRAYTGCPCKTCK